MTVPPYCPTDVKQLFSQCFSWGMVGRVGVGFRSRINAVRRPTVFSDPLPRLGSQRECPTDQAASRPLSNPPRFHVRYSAASSKLKNGLMNRTGSWANAGSITAAMDRAQLDSLKPFSLA